MAASVLRNGFLGSSTRPVIEHTTALRLPSGGECIGNSHATEAYRRAGVRHL
jgi:hypothetical protein